jgi:small multidrug resistance pump
MLLEAKNHYSSFLWVNLFWEGNMGYIYLSIAIITEVIATTALKASESFTKLYPSVVVIVGYGVSFYLFSHVLKTIPVGIAYAIWAGVGIAVVTVAGAFIYRQVPDVPAIIGIGFIVTGVVVINAFSKTVGL